MEEKRLQMSREDIESSFTRLEEAFDGVPGHFVCNMDEMGHQEWADQQEKACYVPASRAICRRSSFQRSCDDARTSLEGPCCPHHGQLYSSCRA
jgi:hypothetical protein